MAVAAERPAKVVSAATAKIARPEGSRIGQDGKRVAMRSLGQLAPKPLSIGPTTTAPIAAPTATPATTVPEAGAPPERANAAPAAIAAKASPPKRGATPRRDAR